MCILLYMIMCMLLSATSTHSKWELMLYCLHCPTLNKVFLLLLLLYGNPWYVFPYITTRTIRMPVFWGYPPPPHDYQYYWVILDPKSKYDKVKVTKLKNPPKFSNFWILKQILHATHLLKLLDEMCKYEMDPMRIVEDKDQTWFFPQTDRPTDGHKLEGSSGQKCPSWTAMDSCNPSLKW